MPITTPQKRRGNASPARSPRTPGPCPYKGLEVTVPGAMLNEPGCDDKAVIRGWNNRNTDQVVVKFEDGVTYWFPLDDVLKWMGPTAAATAAAAAAAQPRTTSSPLAATPHTTTARRRSSRLAAAAAAADDTAAVPTANEVFSMPVWPQGEPPVQHQLSPGRGRKLHARGQQLLQKVGGRGNCDETRGLVVIGVSVLGLLVAMVLACYMARYPAHDLETFMDNLSNMPKDVWDALYRRSLV